MNPYGDNKRHFKKHDVKVGMIIRAPLHEEYYTDTKASGFTAAVQAKRQVTKPTTFVSNTFHGPVFSKGRPFIVLSKHFDHYIAIPLYTHNGAGVKDKPDGKQGEYVSVFDSRIKRDPKNTGQTKHGWLDAHFNADIGTYDPMSVAWLTHPVSRDYRLRVQYEGKLTTSSMRKFLDLCKKAHRFPEEN